MTTPAPAIPPRQPGETPYAYRTRRSLALYGQTPYQRRISLGFARGKTRQEARGKPLTTESEYERRNRISIEQTGFTVTQRRNMAIDAWLASNGYSPATTGMSQTALRRIQPRLRWINENTSIGGQLTPGLIRDAIDMERSGEYEVGWVTDRVFKRYDSMRDFKNGSNATGNYYWFNEGGAEAEIGWAAWWYYH